MNLLHSDNGPELLNGNLRTVSKTWNILVHPFYSFSFSFTAEKQAGTLRRHEQPCTVYTYPQSSRNNFQIKTQRSPNSVPSQPKPPAAPFFFPPPQLSLPLACFFTISHMKPESYHIRSGCR